jgi:uncharacterized protein (TIGR02996 family)
MRSFPELLAFLRACKEAPDDDAPRLVLADWLEEQGNQHGAAMRLQCRAGHIDEADPARDALDGEADRILREAPPDWLTAWRQHTPDVEVRRGLGSVTFAEGRQPGPSGPDEQAWAWIDRLTLDRVDRAMRFLRGAPDSAGLNELSLHSVQLGPRNITALTRLPCLAPIVRLNFDSSLRGTEALAALIRGGKRLTRLRRLDLALASLRFDGIDLLARSDLAPRLTHLGLVGSFLGSGLTVRLADAPALAGLESLDLACCELSDGLGGLVRAPFPLRELRLNANRLTGQAALDLDRAPWLSRLEHLNISNNTLGEDGVRALAATEIPSLRALDLSLVQAGGEVAEILTRAPWLCQLRSLDLGQDELTDHSAQTLAKVPFERLTSLAVQWNSQLASKGARALARAPGLARLRELVLAGCPIGGAGARALAESAVLTRLRALHLSGCKIGAQGAAALASSPILAPVRDLSLSNNAIKDPGVKALARSPHVVGLTRLMLDGNPITDAGSRALAESPYLVGLQTLVISYTNISDKGAALLRERFPWADLEEL